MSTARVHTSAALAAIEMAQTEDFSGAMNASAFMDALRPVVDALDEAVYGLEDVRDTLEGLSFDDPPERESVEDCGADDRAHGETGGNVEGCPDCDTIYDTAMTDWREAQESALLDALGEIG